MKTCSLKFLLLVLVCCLFPLTAVAQRDVKQINNLNLKKFEQNIEQATENGYMPTDARVVLKGNRPTYSLTLVKAKPGQIWTASADLSSDEFWEKYEKGKQAQMKVVCHREYMVKRKLKHLAIWRFDKDYGPTPDYGVFPKTTKPKRSIAKYWDSSSEIPQTGKFEPGFKKVDELVLSFLRTSQIPGVSLAVSFKGDIIYQRCFGYSHFDSMTTYKPDQPARYFECARPFTSAAVMKLVEQRKLDLETPVFEYLGIKLPNGCDVNLKNITLAHLLHDSAGFDKSASCDPIRSPHKMHKEDKLRPITEQEIKEFMLNQTLSFKPGTNRRHASFGFYLLGRAIEKASGMSYEDFVQKNFIRPLKLDSISLAKTRIEDRPKNEVTYHSYSNNYEPIRFDTKDYGKWVLMPDSIDMKLWDSAGGWIGTPADLLRFTAAVREPGSPILSPESVKATFEIPPYKIFETKGKGARAYAAKGWMVGTNEKRSSQIGGTNGTVSMIYYYGDGMGWAITANTLANSKGSHLANVFNDGRLNREIKEATANLRK